MLAGPGSSPRKKLGRLVAVGPDEIREIVLPFVGGVGGNFDGRDFHSRASQVADGWKVYVLAVSINDDVVATLHKLERRREQDIWGLHAATIAQGIDRSGVAALLGDLRSDLREQVGTLTTGLSQVDQSVRGVESATRDVKSAVLALAAVNSLGFQQVCMAIAGTNQLLGSIEVMIANPLTTSAAERYRRGVGALQNGWYDDALKELNASIEQDPFQAVTHFARGVALGALSEDSDSVEAFRAVIKYTGNDPLLQPVAAGAAILAMQVLQRSGDRTGAAEVLSAAMDKGGRRCAELLLAGVAAGGGRPYMKDALSLAPELWVVAVMQDLPGAREVAAEVATDPEGPIQQMRRAAAEAKAAGLSKAEPPKTMPEAMTYHKAWRQTVASELGPRSVRLTEERRRGERSLEDAEKALASFTHRQPKLVLPQLIISLVFTGGSTFLFWNSISYLANSPDGDGYFSHLGLGVLGLGSALIGLAFCVHYFGEAGKDQKSLKWSGDQFSALTEQRVAAKRLAIALETKAEHGAAAASAAQTACRDRIYPLTPSMAD